MGTGMGGLGWGGEEEMKRGFGCFVCLVWVGLVWIEFDALLMRMQC